MAEWKTVTRGRDQRSSRRSVGSARATARLMSSRGIERRRRARGSQGADSPAAIWAATRASSKPQTKGMGGGMGRQFGRPRMTINSAKARPRRTDRRSPTVKRSLGCVASVDKTSEVRGFEDKRAFWGLGMAAALRP
jgi:hypothetical protein